MIAFLGLSTCFWKWLLCSLGAFLLGWLLHWWLFGRGWKEKVDVLTKERDDWHAKYVNLEKDYAGLKYQLEEADKKAQGLRASLQLCEADKMVLNTKLTALQAAGDGTGIAMGASRGGGISYLDAIGQDNLQVVEGIGPKIEQILKEKGITTWALLGAASYDTLKQIMDGAGPRYRMHDPKTWAKQASLANEGKWSELIEYQKFLGAGREDSAAAAGSDSKVEKMLLKSMGFSNNQEDLKVIEGIGPKIEGLLKAAGILNWGDLAAASVERLRGILDAAGENFRMAEPGTWPKQATLAHQGKWEELHGYQEFLDGGKEPA